jgi:hypothetical protein
MKRHAPSLAAIGGAPRSVVAPIAAHVCAAPHATEGVPPGSPAAHRAAWGPFQPPGAADADTRARGSGVIRKAVTASTGKVVQRASQASDATPLIDFSRGKAPASSGASR